MKIIHLVLGKANPERMNGVNKVAHSLATNQVEAGAEVEIWGITPTPKSVVKDRSYKVQLFQSHLNKFSVDAKLKKAIQELGQDTVVHLHAGFIPDFPPIARLLTKLGIRYVITPHGNYMEGAMHKNAFFKKKYFQWMEKDMLQNAFFVHCIGRGEITDLQKLGTFDNIQLIPNGQDFAAFQFLFQELPKPSTPVFGFCGRITRFQKGLDLLMDGFLKYKSENGKGVLWLIGDGEYKEDIEDFIQKHSLQNDVKLFGTRFGEEKLNIMANMDAFYHPSRNEGLPMAVLEAAALRKPLVVSEFTNMTEYVSEYQAGICLPENTPDEIAKSMREIESLKVKGELNAFGQNARKMAEENFDWKMIALKMIEAYAKDSSLTRA